jgi:hypothetical protein
VPQPFAVQRLRNGNTFIAGRQTLLELDRAGKEVYHVQRLNETVLAARRLNEGAAFVTYQGTYVRLDAAGKEAKTFRVPFNPNSGASGAEVCPGDRVIISVQNLNKVTEYDADGKTVWEATVQQPGMPTRLANGHTLVPILNTNKYVELDRAGKVVSEKGDLPVRPFRVYRR